MDADTAIQPDLQRPLSSTDDNGAPTRRSATSALIEPPEGAKWTKTIHPRGRQARDPLAQQVKFTVTSADQMEKCLRDYLANPTSAAEHTTLEFSFPTASAFMVYTGDYTGGSQPKENLYGTLNRSALSVDAALSACVVDVKDGLKKQKSIAKTLVEYVQKADGFRYSFHNNWLSKEDEAHRFSYFCNDGTLNKGRAANEGAGMNGKRKMKPVYDCQGTIHVKFSVTKQHMELHYKHIPMHPTYEERAPVPRKNSKRRKIMEVFEPEKLVRDRKRKAKVDLTPKSRKRRATEPPPGTADALSGEGATDSLAPLIDFLGSADQEANRDSTSPSGPMLGEGDGPPSGPPFSAEKLDELKKRTRRQYKTPRQGVVRPPTMQVPGMMSGYISGDLITWGLREKKKSKDQAGTEPLAGIAQAAAEVDAGGSGGLTELEMLKAKLAEAEQRIHRLEAEKTQAKNGPPAWPPPPPPAYGFQPAQFGQMPFSQQQYHHYPPPPQTGQHMSPTGQNGTPQGQLRTVQWEPKLVSGGGRKGRPAARDGNQDQQQAPPRGGQLLEL